MILMIEDGDRVYDISRVNGTKATVNVEVMLVDRNAERFVKESLAESSFDLDKPYVGYYDEATDKIVAYQDKSWQLPKSVTVEQWRRQCSQELKELIVGIRGFKIYKVNQSHNLAENEQATLDEINEYYRSKGMEFSKGELDISEM